MDGIGIKKTYLWAVNRGRRWLRDITVDGSFTCRELAQVLGVAETKVSQCVHPALEKVAKCWRYDATRTVKAILNALNDLPDLCLDQAAALRELRRDDIDFQCRIKTGRVNRQELGHRDTESTEEEEPCS